MNQIAPCVFKNEVIINLTIFLFKYKRLLSSYSKFCVAYLHISLNVFVNRFQTLDYQICWRKTYQGILKSAWFCYDFINTLYHIVYMDHIIWSILEQFLHINRWINENIVAFVDDEKSIHCETIIFVQIRSNWNFGRIIISTSFFKNWFHHFSPSLNRIMIDGQ